MVEPLKSIVGRARAKAIAKSALRMLWRFRLRSALIVLAATIGVAGVTVSSSYSEAGRQKVLAQLRRLGANIIAINPRTGRAAGSRARTGALATTLVPRDYDAIRRDVDGLRATSATSSGIYLIKAGDLSKNNSPVLGIESSYLKIRGWSLSAGNNFDEQQDRRGARVAVLGASAARDLFGEEPPLRRRIFINRVPFEVLGVLTELGQDLDGGGADNTVYVPLTTQMHRLSNLDYYSGIALSVTNWERMDEVTTDVDTILLRTHRPVGNDPLDYQILNQRTLVDAEVLASKRLEGYVRIVSASALVVAGLGILAISWISVTERASEIGLRRALGATKRDIFAQFIFEASALSLVGCAIGLAVGVGTVVEFVDRTSGHFGSIWSIAGGTCVVAFALSIAFASLPSYRAAMLDPIRCLRAA